MVSLRFLRFIACGGLTAVLVSSSALAQEAEPAKPDAKQPNAAGDVVTDKITKDNKSWKPLLPAKGLEGWEITDFGSQGEVTWDGKLLVLGMGDPLTGINRKKLQNFPTENFEIELEAKRIEGSDFLCGLTFPVGDEFCSLIAGGWGGGLVGLSSVDGFDASENATGSYLGFDNGKWYKFRVRVDPEYVRAWIDDKETIRQERDRHEFSTRIEVYVSQPLGYCVFQSKVAVRNFRWRALEESELPAKGKP